MSDPCPPSLPPRAPGLLDVVLPLLGARDRVVLQLVCRTWAREARLCVRDAVPRCGTPGAGLARHPTD